MFYHSGPQVFTLCLLMGYAETCVLKFIVLKEAEKKYGVVTPLLRDVLVTCASSLLTLSRPYQTPRPHQ